MRKYFIIACALLMALATLPAPEAEAGRYVSRRSFNQASRNFRRAGRTLDRFSRTRRSPVRYSSGIRSSRSFGRSGIFIGF